MVFSLLNDGLIVTYRKNLHKDIGMYVINIFSSHEETGMAVYNKSKKLKLLSAPNFNELMQSTGWSQYNDKKAMYRVIHNFKRKLEDVDVQFYTIAKDEENYIFLAYTNDDFVYVFHKETTRYRVSKLTQSVSKNGKKTFKFAQYF